MEWSVDWQMIGSVVAILGLTYTMFRNLKSDLKNDIREVKTEIKEVRGEIALSRIEAHEVFSKVNKDLSEIKESVSFLEAANIYTMPAEPVQPNSRSQAAREMWKRRKQKRLDSKSSK